MKECRRRRYPQCPHTLAEFAQQLLCQEHARNLEYNAGRLSVMLITDINDSQHVVFYDENFIREEMSEVARLFIDATFRSRPRIEGVYQLLTIMGVKLNHVSFLLYTILWSVCISIETLIERRYLVARKIC